MPEWHHSDFSRTIYALPESTKKKVKNQVTGPPKIRTNSTGLIMGKSFIVMSFTLWH